MKKYTLFTLAVCFLAVFSIMGCKSGGSQVASPGVDECTFPDDGVTPAPLWVCDAPVPGIEVSAVGSAEQTKAGYDFQKDMAAAAGRERLASQMKVKVSKMIKRYAETTGVGEAETVDKVNTAVSKLITHETLVGSKIYRTHKNPKTGVLFTLVGVDKANLQDNVKQAVNSSMKNDKALWQKFQAGKAQEELAAGIANTKAE